MYKTPTIIFFGSSANSVIVLKKLLAEGTSIPLVVTVNDAPVGRKHILTKTPVKQFAIENNTPFLTAEKLDTPIIEKIKESLSSNPLSIKGEGKGEGLHSLTSNVIDMSRPDFLVVADYRLFIPQALLDLPKYAPLNIHPSLLPKYRGPTPVPATILAGETVSGTTVIRMNNKLDAGDILLQETYRLNNTETSATLLPALFSLGANMIVRVIREYIDNKANPFPQDESQATLTPYFSKQDSFVDSKNPPSKEQIDRMIRAFYPWPTVWTRLRLGYGGQAKEKIVKLLPEKMIQVEGGKPMKVKDFLNGYPEVIGIIENLV